MNLREVNLKKSYDSDTDDILHDFYIPILSNSVYYKRLAGFFSSSSLAVAAKGITKLIENGGKMELITCARLQKADIEIIEKAFEKSEEIISKYFINDLKNLNDEFMLDHVKALGWMIANKKLEIKIALVKDENNRILSQEEIDKKGIFHQKVGIFEDQLGNKLSFSGSQNESANAWTNNVEEIKIFRNWIPEEEKYFEADINKFNKYWEGKSKRMLIIDAPQAVKDKLVSIAPRDIKTKKDILLLNLDKYYNKVIKPNNKVISLRNYQETAIKNWVINQYKGIFEMATGTGKTYAAFGCLEKVMEKEQNLLCVISAPYNHLVKQWKKEMKKISDDGDQNIFFKIKNLSKNNQIIIGSSNYKWKKELSNKITKLESGLLNNLIIYTTHDTLKSDFFIKKISSSKLPLMLIVDEVHGAGTTSRKTGLLNEYRYRLGLSATPRRWMDEEGTELIFDFFDNKENKPTYEFSLEEAINRINPLTGKTFLTPYQYLPYFTSLNEEEAEEYLKLSKLISKVGSYKDSSDDALYRYNRLIEKRANIIKSAANKLIILDEIIKDLKEKNDDIKDLLIYCNPGGQLEKVQMILNEKRIKQCKFTSDENVVPEKKYLGLSEREYILKNFSEGHYQALVAMKCLDEGVDIPSAKIGIIMASSTNPREFIQRRGRLLRYFPGKSEALIYDIIIMPPKTDQTNMFLLEQDKNLLKKEITRYKEFAKIAKNSGECLIKLIEIEKKYGFYF